MSQNSIEKSIQRVADCPGFAIARSGGRLHGNIPPRNLEAYFEAQVENGASPEDWRTCCHVDKKK